MPTLASVNENSGGPLRLSAYQPSLQPRRNVRRCLFGKVSDDDRKRIDNWLKTELELHSVEKSIQWGYDFNNDTPFTASNADPVLVQVHQDQDDPIGLARDDFDWLPCRADSVPEFYHSSHGKSKSLKPPVKLASKQREDDTRTPVKKKIPSKKAVQQIPCTSLFSPSSAEEFSFAAISSGSDEESTAMEPEPEESTARESYVVDSGLSPISGASILAVQSSQIADTTPQRPGEPSFSMASSSRNSFIRATTTGSASRRASGSDQTKLTSFYQLRKRSHRLSAGEKLGSVEDHVISDGAKLDTANVGVDLTVNGAELPIKIPRSSYSTSSRN